MRLDDLLKQPLAPVRDDGFSAQILLRLTEERQRRQNLAWLALMVCALVLAGLLPLAQASAMAAGWLAKLASSQIFAYVAGGLMLLWAWRPRPFRL